MTRRPSLWFLLAWGLILCNGCMTYRLYDGDQRPKGKLGIIKLGVIRDIDEGNFQYLTHHDLAVLPDLYTLGLFIKRGKATDCICSFDVEVEAGHVYQGVVERDKSRSGKPPVVSIVDRTANLVVARYPPLPSASFKIESTTVAPVQRAKADQTPVDGRPPPVPLSLAATPSAPRGGKPPLAPQAIEKLRRLRQRRNEGLITHEEYVRQGNALVGSP